MQASADISLDAMSEQTKLATLCKQMTLENTGQSKTSRTLVEIQNFLYQINQEVKLFKNMCSVFTVTFPALKKS